MREVKLGTSIHRNTIRVEVGSLKGTLVQDRCRKVLRMNPTDGMLEL
jgi:hypothetical protein